MMKRIFIYLLLKLFIVVTSFSQDIESRETIDTVTFIHHISEYARSILDHNLSGKEKYAAEIVGESKNLEISMVDKIAVNNDAFLSVIFKESNCTNNSEFDCAVIVRYKWINGIWNIQNIAPFYPEVRLIDIDGDNINEIYLELMDCKLGNCEWHKELFKLNYQLNFQSIISKQSFSDINNILYLMLEDSKKLDYLTIGDTLENLVSWEFNDLEQDGCLELIKKESIHIFDSIEKDVLITEQYTRTSICHFKNQEYICEQSEAYQTKQRFFNE